MYKSTIDVMLKSSYFSYTVFFSRNIHNRNLSVSETDTSRYLQNTSRVTSVNSQNHKKRIRA